MKKLMILVVVFAMLFTFSFADGKCQAKKKASKCQAKKSSCCKAQKADKKAVAKAIVAGYVQAVHIDRDIVAFKKGFHKDFSMLVQKGNDVVKVARDDWAGKLAKWKEKVPTIKEKVEHKFSMINVAGNAAVARVEIMKDGKHIFTDFLSLYKYSDGWKIVAKTYIRHK